MKKIICTILFILTLALAAETAFAAGFGVFTGGPVSFKDREISIRRNGSSEHREIRISDPNVKVVDARWYGDKLVVQIIYKSGRKEQRVYSSFGSYSNK